MTTPRLFVVTLAYRAYGPAIVSHMTALRRWRDEHPGTRADHYLMYGQPALTDGQDIVTLKYVEAREVFLRGIWDVFVAIEDDMIIPPDTFHRLTAALNGADVAYGLYAFRHNRDGHKWSAALRLTANSWHSIVQDPAQAKAAWGKLVDVQGVGLGCTAITRRALEQIPFVRRGHACNDWYFALDARKLGFVQRCDLGLVCGHMTVEPSPRILYPDPSVEGLTRVEFL